MSESENDTQSYREEQGKPADADADREKTELPLGSAMRGPIGREGAEPPIDSDAEADRRAARDRE